MNSHIKYVIGLREEVRNKMNSALISINLLNINKLEAILEQDSIVKLSQHKKSNKATSNLLIDEINQ